MIETIIDFLTSNYEYRTHGILSILAGFLNMGLGVLVYLNNRKSPTHRAYLLLTFVCFAWLFGHGMPSLVKDIDEAKLWIKFSYLFGVPFLSTASFLFISELTGDKKNRKRNLTWLLLGSPLMLPILFFIDHFYGFQTHGFWRYPLIIRTPLSITYYLSLVTFFYTFAYLCFRNLYKAWKKTTNVQLKLQIRNILIGYSIAYTASADFFSAVFKGFYPFGYISMTIFFGIVAYTIVRHRLLEINLIIKRLSAIFLIYLGLLVIVTPIVILALIQLRSQTTENPLSLLMGLSLLIGIVFSFGPIIYANLLRHSFWLRGSMATGLVHGLKIPLSAIQGASEIIVEELNKTKIDRNRSTSYIKMIQDNASRLETYVKDLLNIATIENQDFQLEKSVFELKTLGESLVDQYQPLAQKNNCQLNFSSGEPFPIQADKNKITQTISNLIANAIKFSEKGNIQVSIKKIEGEIHFSVSD